MKLILILSLSLPLAAQAPVANVPPLPVTGTVQIKPCTIGPKGGTCLGYTISITGTTKATSAPVTVPAHVIIMLDCNPAALVKAPAPPNPPTLTLAGMKCTITQVAQ